MKRFVAFLILITLFSCGREPQLFHIENGDDFASCMRDNKFTIFCYMDSSDCTSCSMQWLSRWRYFEEDLNKLNTNVALIVQKMEKESVFETMKRRNLDFPIIFDGSWSICLNNPEIFSQYSVFVVNRKKEIVWKGLPIENEDTWKSFCKTIRRKSLFNW